MNFYEELTSKEINLIKDAGVKIENKKYEKEELTMITNKLTEFIMNHSLKNGDLKTLQNDFNNVFAVIERNKIS